MLIAVPAADAVASPGIGHSVSYDVTEDWGSGFQGQVAITNDGLTPTVSWQLEFDSPHELTSVWDAVVASHAGSHYAIKGAHWNASVPAGGRVTFGFVARPGGPAAAVPTNCTLNGMPCVFNGGVTPPAPDTTAPSVPSDLVSTDTTSSTISLGWSASTDDVGVTGYDVYRDTAKVGTATGTSFTDSGLAASTTYGYTVTARDAAGNSSAASAALAVATKAATPASPGLTATFAKTSDWGSGFVGSYTVNNGGSSAVEGWKLEFDLPAGEKITAAWSGVLTVSGNHYTLTNAAWNGRIGASAGATVGFQGTRGATWSDPAACTVNGRPCAGAPPAPDTTAPSVPSELVSTDTTSSTISLGWSASTDDVGVTGYDVYRDTAKVGTATGTSFTDSGLAASTTYGYTVTARDAAGNSSAASAALAVATKAATPTPPPGDGRFAFAPYADMTLWPPFDLTGTAREVGLRYYSLAFITSGGNCRAAWGGVIPLADDSTIGPDVESLRDLGGDVIVSFGGAAGVELGGSCTSVTALQSQYQAVIDRYDLTRIDFDIEGAVADGASADRRSRAIAALQSEAAARGKRLDVTFTLPVLPSGLTREGLDVLRSAIDNGVEITAVNVMAMDYGDGAAPDPQGRMGYYAIQAATSLHDQLRALYPAASDEELWRLVGVTPMIGVNDVASEIFTVADAEQLVDFATAKQLGMLSMWSAARDKQCAGGASNWASPVCSSILQQPFEFSRAFNRYAG